MTKRTASLAIATCAIVLALALKAGMTAAQDRSPQIMALGAVRHAVLPPL